MGVHLVLNDKHSSSSIFFTYYLQVPSGPLLCICIVGEKVENELGTK
jgi:hypothetical protein